MPTKPDQIEDAVNTKLKEIGKLEDALDHEPQNLPRALPVTTLLIIRFNPVQAETGPHDDVTYDWRLSLYVKLNDFRTAQQEFKDLVPAILSKVRSIPTAGGLCDFLNIEDVGDEPVFAPSDGFARKSLLMHARLTEV